MWRAWRWNDEPQDLNPKLTLLPSCAYAKRESLEDNGQTNDLISHFVLGSRLASNSEGAFPIVGTQWEQGFFFFFFPANFSSRSTGENS
jgi:hypothetical protein